MYMQAYMHDLRAQDPPCLSGTNSFKISLHQARGLGLHRHHTHLSEENGQ